jgi:hypothetical protein
MIHWHHLRHAQLSQAIDKMHPHVKSADGTEAVSSDLIQEDSIGSLSCISIGPEILPSLMNLCLLCCASQKYAAPGGRQKPGHGDASNWITTSGGCIRAGSQSDRRTMT